MKVSQTAVEVEMRGVLEASEVKVGNDVVLDHFQAAGQEVRWAIQRSCQVCDAVELFCWEYVHNQSLVCDIGAHRVRHDVELSAGLFITHLNFDLPAEEVRLSLNHLR